MSRFDVPRVLGLREARALGISESAVRNAVANDGWQRLLRGVVLTRTDPPTRDDWALAGLTVAGPRAALSGWDAIRTCGIGNASPPSGRVLVLTPSGNQRSGVGVLVRRTSRTYRSTLLPAEHPTLPYVPVAHPARAVADTALLYDSRAPVRALATAAIQRRLCHADELVDEYEAGPRGDSYWLRRALEDVLVNAHSVAEAEAADALGRMRIPSFELNVAIVDDRGRHLATADILWRELRAVGEIDSRAFHFDEQSWHASMARHNLLTAHGLAVAHWPPALVRADPATWAAGVGAWLRQRATELGVGYCPGRGALTPPAGGPPPFLIR